MTVDVAIVPGLIFLLLELLALAAVGYVVARVVLRQGDQLLALAQGLVIGLALWGLAVNFVFLLLPGLAGAAAGWIAVLAVGVGLAWRAPAKLQISLRTLVGSLAVGLGLGWIALAGRQLLTIPDSSIHLALSAAIRAGVHPPALSWNPGVAVPYHYGVDLLIGLLMPPTGPDIALTTEVLGAYVWTSFALLVVTTLRRGGSWFGALLLMPLLLSAGTWTLVLGDPPPILRVPVVSGIPMAGLRASLAGVYWPTLNLPGDWAPYFETPPPNIWTPPFVLGYALALVVLERVAARSQRPWLEGATLALLIGFLGLVEETVALTVLGIWVVITGLSLAVARSEQMTPLAAIQRSVPGPALTLLVLAVAGGPLTGVFTGGLGGSLSLGAPGNLAESRLLVTFQQMDGEVGLLGLGAIPVAALALTLGWRRRLVVALALGSGVFMFAALTLQFSAFQFDVGRLDGHTRNFALLALMVALSTRLHALSSRWRVAVAGGLFVLFIWPTIATPAHKVRLALDRGIQLANATPAPPSDFVAQLQHMGRHVLEPFATAEIAAYIRNRTEFDTRILSPDPTNLSIHTGRPSASGFAGHVHLFPFTGPDYEDAIRFLEPAALQRLEYRYVHATENWIAGLPVRAQEWLADPTLFTPVIRDGTHTLYRVESSFLALRAEPTPQSFEALRQVVPNSANVFMSAGIQTISALQVAAALPHAKLAGTLRPSHLYLLTEIPIDPDGDPGADVVVVARDRAMNASAHAFPPIWWNDAAIAYATSPAVTAAIAPPPQPESDFVVRISNIKRSADQIAFHAEFIDRASARWTGQDWLVIAVDPSPWSLPSRYAADGYALVGERWYAGQLVPSGQPVDYRYVFDGLTQQLAVHDQDGRLDVLQSSGDRLSPGAYVLAVRLRHHHLQAATIPVLKITIAEDGLASFATFKDDRGVAVTPCPSRLLNSESCRRLATEDSNFGK